VNGSYPDTGDQKYLYDGLQRLTSSDEGQLAAGSITNRTLTQTFALDQLGNWAKFSEHNDGGFLLYQERAHNAVNEIAGNGGDPITATTGPDWIDPVYDAAGNMTEAPSPLDPTVKHKYVYDAWNRLVKVTDGNDAAIVTNEYDGLGQRIVKDVAGGSTEDRDYYYNDQWQLIVEAKGGSAYAIYHWHPFYIDALATRMRASDTHFFLHDANFNVTAAVDDSGNAVAERYSYTAYGEVAVLDADFAVDTDGTDIGNTHLYTGRERDPETGLQLNRHRFYAAHLGRWLNRDPIGYEGSPYNLYEYVNGMPIGGLDPEGLFTFYELIQAACCLRYASFCECSEANGCATAARKQSAVFGGGRQEAMRHCIWSCCTAQAVHNSTTALLVVGCHENSWGRDSGDECRDRYNNGVGVHLGHPTFGGKNTCFFLCKQALLRGMLQTKPGCGGFGGPNSPDRPNG
jgi:RHS repeat-associated protein